MQELESWLILNHAPGIGPIRAQKILEIFDKPENIICCQSKERKQTGLFPKPALDYFAAQNFTLIDKDLALLKELNTNIIHLGHADYPQLLSEIPDPPLVLYLRGSKNILSMPQVSIVGSRNPDAVGRRLSYTFARDLAQNGVTITSGMASGIDTCAHQGGLQGNAGTIAVMGTGLDRIYPGKNRELAHKIAANGLLLSEFAPGTGPKAENFPRRNRVISGLSLGTLVVQAALKSGSLITARLASEQGREVFAVPGAIKNPLTRGTHALIKQGAKLVETTNDILEELPGMLQLVQSMASEVTTKDKDSSLLQYIEFEPMLIDDLVSKSQLAVDKVSAELLELELVGKVQMLSGTRVQRIA